MPQEGAARYERRCAVYRCRTLALFLLTSRLWEVVARSSASLDCIDDVACTSWVSPNDISNCSKFRSLLQLNCPKACGVCNRHDIFRRCLSAADLRANNTALVTSSSSLASLANGIVANSASWAMPAVEVLEKPLPLLLQADDFLSASEAKDLIDVAERTGFQSSSRYIDGAAELRTSVTTFCKDTCAWAPSVAALVDRISDALGVPWGYFEPVQFVRYNDGEYYTEHSDFIPEDIETASGPRLLTFFIYLSDKFDGGETDFPKLSKRVSPKVGRIATWTNAMTYVGGKSGKIRWLPDGKTNHEALRVTATASTSAPKYAANVWIHNNDVRHAELYHERCQAALALNNNGIGIASSGDNPLEL